MAKAAGEARLAELNKGDGAADAKAAWSPLKSASRMQARDLPAPALQAIFKANGAKLPAYSSAAVGGNYVLYRIVKVSAPEPIDDGKRKGLQSEYAGIVAQQDLSAYLAGLRARYKIIVNAAVLEAKAQ